MNDKLPRLVLVGLGVAVMAVLSVLTGKGASSADQGGVLVACGHYGEPTCAQTVATSVRG